MGAEKQRVGESASQRVLQRPGRIMEAGE
jgi:hypothetical protein